MRSRTWGAFGGVAVAVVLAGNAPAAPQAASATPAAPASQPAPAPTSPFTYEEVMVPMRDGARLQTVILRPVGRSERLPILLQRTPYGVPAAAPGAAAARRYGPLMRDGYLFVFQSMRGRFKSDGDFTLSTAVHPRDRGAVDESTDAYDTIDWLVRHVPGNNGRVGIWGVSYPGLAAGMALVHPHPALKAASPQAAWVDYWLSDDLHRNGALRLSYATDWLYSLQHDKAADADFAYPTPDTYEWFLGQGNAAAVNALQGSLPMFTALIDHPDHDRFYTAQNWQEALGRTVVPTLNVAGFWDQEDPWGSWQIYARQQRNDPDHLAQMVAGPWNHGGWQGRGDMLGPIPLGTESGTQFQEQIQAPFFRYWLHGQGPRPDFAARMFESGSNQWRTYASWPPAGATPTSLYLRADGTLSFTGPAADEGCRQYLSDPANPVPFRARPISPTYPAPEWRWWEAADQRFVDHRPDVLSWTSAPLTADLTVTGRLAATIFASTSGTDSDLVVKLIDVYPADAQPFDPTGSRLGDYPRQLNGYQLPVAMDVRRGRFLASDTDPRPLVPNRITEWNVPLRDHDHVFLKGHRIMVQVQSSWFPMIDRNPQSFVPNIARARPADYVIATQRVCSAPAQASRVVLPVMK